MRATIRLHSLGLAYSRGTTARYSWASHSLGSAGIKQKRPGRCIKCNFPAFYSHGRFSPARLGGSVSPTVINPELASGHFRVWDYRENHIRLSVGRQRRLQGKSVIRSFCSCLSAEHQRPPATRDAPQAITGRIVH